MAKPRKLTQRRGWAMSVCVAILRPLLMLLTKRRWLDGDKLPATGGCVVPVFAACETSTVVMSAPGSNPSGCDLSVFTKRSVM